MRLLDLFCCAGGAGEGYHRAGFEVVGVDIEPQPRYPFEFYQADALAFVAEHGHEFDAVHASPPCQGYSSMRYVTGREYPRLISDTRRLLTAIGKPYVIENVEGAYDYMVNPAMLCGTMFDLRVFRHRLFESNVMLMAMPHRSHRHYGRAAKQGRMPSAERQYVTCTGSYSGAEYARRAMGIDWMNRHEMAQAIPPAYTEFIGMQLMHALQFQEVRA